MTRGRGGGGDWVTRVVGGGMYLELVLGKGEKP
jgi:hypothetical protein